MEFDPEAQAPPKRVRDAGLGRAVAPAGVLFTGTALVVEDNMLIAMEAEDQLRELGYARCELAGSSERAIALIASHEFRIALLDVNLGHETSAEVADVLRQRAIPFIVTSGYGEVADLDQRFAGAPVVTKPYSAGDIAAALARIDG